MALARVQSREVSILLLLLMHFDQPWQLRNAKETEASAILVTSSDYVS